MPNETLNLAINTSAINTSALDEAQAKADKLLATLLQIHQMQCKPADDIGQTSYSFLEASRDVVVKNKVIELPAPVTPPPDTQLQILVELQKISRAMVCASDIGVASGLIGTTGPDHEIVGASQHR